jgi:hypothetical protein
LKSGEPFWNAEINVVLFDCCLESDGLPIAGRWHRVLRRWFPSEVPSSSIKPRSRARLGDHELFDRCDILQSLVASRGGFDADEVFPAGAREARTARVGRVFALGEAVGDFVADDGAEFCVGGFFLFDAADAAAVEIRAIAHARPLPVGPADEAVVAAFGFHDASLFADLESAMAFVIWRSW